MRIGVVTKSLFPVSHMVSSAIIHSPTRKKKKTPGGAYIQGTMAYNHPCMDTYVHISSHLTFDLRYPQSSHVKPEGPPDAQSTIERDRV